MYPFNRLLVGLALRGKDEFTLKSVELCIKMTRAKRVYFVHIVDPRRLRDMTPEEAKAEADDVPEHERVLKRMQDLVDEVCGPHPETDFRYEVLYGQRLGKMVEFAIDKDIDLIVIGSEEDASRVYPEKVTRGAPCSVLVVPESARAQVDRILVPTDFSKLSAEAMKVAVSCCELIEGESLTIHHVLQVPSGYHKTGKSYEEVSAKLREQSIKECDEFLEQFDTEGLPINVECAISNRVVKSIGKSEKENDANIIFIGARGRTGPTAFLLGSVTEKLIRTTSVLLMAVKKKGANMSFLEALFEL
jgi:nucleotide-binding universal stress UspA family protein